MRKDLLYRLRALFHPEQMDNEVDEELRNHLEHEAEKYLHEGVAPGEALRRARLALQGAADGRQRANALLHRSSASFARAGPRSSDPDGLSAAWRGV